MIAVTKVRSFAVTGPIPDPIRGRQCSSCWHRSPLADSKPKSVSARLILHALQTTLIPRTQYPQLFLLPARAHSPTPLSTCLLVFCLVNSKHASAPQSPAHSPPPQSPWLRRGSRASWGDSREVPRALGENQGRFGGEKGAIWGPVWGRIFQNRPPDEIH